MVGIILSFVLFVALISACDDDEYYESGSYSRYEDDDDDFDLDIHVGGKKKGSSHRGGGPGWGK
ncbi:hypothetical protein GCM10022402_02570 [Salinactinospora qingdaonensis]|uniref:Uncharacterized protein n=1 Tax=Salinactinospora qingdaonensis TaxID=702744 RepID=A0ABP7EUU0_9ACTN